MGRGNPATPAPASSCKPSGGRSSGLPGRCPCTATVITPSQERSTIHKLHREVTVRPGNRTATVTLVPNGPLYVRGDVEVRAANGQLIRRDTRLAFCRCGHSQHKPFCDNSHRNVGFVAPGEPLERT
jgi:CDGSH-type Zn-finger protein